MSRYTKHLDRKENEIFSVTITYGFDNATGYFFQKFDENEGKEENEYIVLDECSTFTKMSNSRMIELMEEYDVNKEHIKQVVLDLEF
jgi:hypothetical protein